MNRNYTDKYDVDIDKESVNIDLTRNDEETAEKVLKQIKRFIKLLALRDQECKGSRGYFPKELEEYYYIYLDGYIYSKYKVNSTTNRMCMNIVPFKIQKDAQKICDILNEGKFDLEG